jgi:hypothetical protein
MQNIYPLEIWVACFVWLPEGHSISPFDRPFQLKNKRAVANDADSQFNLTIIHSMNIPGHLGNEGEKIGGCNEEKWTRVFVTANHAMSQRQVILNKMLEIAK